jgi:hypothetical protein
VSNRQIAILGGATPAEAAAAVACVQQLLAEEAAAASAPEAGRSRWWQEGLDAALHDLPPGPHAPITGGTG